MKLFERLKKELEGAVYADEVTRVAYSVDASIYQVVPQVVVLPKGREDLRRLLQIAQEERVSVTPRGAATGITGSCLGQGIVLDLSTCLTEILEIDREKRTVTVEAGVVQDELNAALHPYGFRLGPNTSTGNRATLGGMVANNAAGSHSLVWGQMSDHLLEAEGLLMGGEAFTFKKEATHNSHPILQRLKKIQEKYRPEIEAHFPKVKRRVTGYNLDALLTDGEICLPRLLAGSEGTLAVVTEMKLNIVPIPKKSTLVLLFFDDLVEASKEIPSLLEQSPSSLELIDREILRAGKQLAKMEEEITWVKGDPAGVFVLEFSGESDKEVEEKLKKLSFSKTLFESEFVKDARAKEAIWNVRKAGLELLLSKRSYQRAVAFIEDIVIPPEHLHAFFQKFLHLLETFGKSSGIYGHVGEGCLHLRPYLDLRSEKETLKEIMAQVVQLVRQFGGAMSGEHGDGRIRSWLNPELFGEALYEAHREVKQAFDPHQLLNPHIIVNPLPVDTHLRPAPQEISTALDFSKEGGFALAVDLCNGNGLCRKRTGTMCPSFQATGKEFDSTRARATALKGLLTGDLKAKSLADPELRRILDLCLMCKGCKRECPSQVDMAKMKTELLYQWNQQKGASLRDRLFAHFGKLSLLLSKQPTFFNWILKSRVARKTQSLFGIASKRTLPQVAEKRFSHLFQEYKQKSAPKKVSLFIDTYTEFYVPEIGIHAVKLLNQMGFEVLAPEWHCCGRTLFSKGFIDEARESLEQLLTRIDPSLPLLSLEPSCHSMLVDDLPSLLPGKTVPQVTPIENFLLEHVDSLQVVDDTLTIAVHDHCHQKALYGKSSLGTLLRKLLPSANVHEIDSGCCGMAGSFGYEKEHYDISLKVAEVSLFKSLRMLPKESVMLSAGFSCRSQIRDQHAPKTYHPIEFLSLISSDLDDFN